VTAEAIVRQFRARGVSLVAEGDTLVVRPASAVTPEEFDTLRHKKIELLALLRPMASAVPPASLHQIVIVPASAVRRDDPDRPPPRGRPGPRAR
jgi:TubC N-terminal docking domain